MKRALLTLAVAGLLGGAAVGLTGCYGASVGVGVHSAPPAAVGVYYDERPGYTYIEGRWAWTAYGWQWYPGYWVEARPGYAYVAGYWDYWGGHWQYRPGIWARQRHGHVWIGGRWTPYRAGYHHHYDYRRGTWVSRGDRGGRAGYHGVRDHDGGRSRGSAVRDHRSWGGGRDRSSPPRDHRRRRD